jgi:hypothetical protein
VLEDWRQRLKVLNDTQEMITKEIWRKKQLLKIMYTNKSFIKQNVVQNVSRNNTFNAGLYGYGGGICYTEELQHQDDFLYDTRKSNAHNGSFHGGKRGVWITREMYKKPIKEEAKEIDRLKEDVDEIRDKIQFTLEFTEKAEYEYAQAKMFYEDKKGILDDLNEFMHWLKAQKRDIKLEMEKQKEKIMNKYIEEIFDLYYEDPETN